MNTVDLLQDATLEEATRLKNLRAILSYSQHRMAKEFMVTHGAIWMWERGVRKIPGPVLKLIEIYEKTFLAVG